MRALAGFLLLAAAFALGSWVGWWMVPAVAVLWGLLRPAVRRPILSAALAAAAAWALWLEVDSLQCHIVHWIGAGKGVVFKAGPGPLAEVGKLGIKGKTPCTECPCIKPEQVKVLEPKPKA